MCVPYPVSRSPHPFKHRSDVTLSVQNGRVSCPSVCRPLPGFALAAPGLNAGRAWPRQYRTGVWLARNPERVHGLEGPVRGERVPGGERVLFLSFFPSPSPSSSSLSAIVGAHHIPNCVPASRWVANPNLCCKASFSIPSSPPIDLAIVLSCAVIWLLYPAGGGGWGRRSRFSVCFVAPPFGP